MATAYGRQPAVARTRAAAPARAVSHAPDYALLSAVIVLVIVGLIAVYSSSYALGYVEYGDTNYFVKRQAVFTALGIGVLLVAMQFNYRLLMRISPLIMLVALLGLAAVLVPGVGVDHNGATRWIQFGPLPEIQPSEFAKLAVLIYMAAWLAAKGDAVKDFSLGVVPFVSMVGIVGALIMLQPDLGTATMVAAITGTLFFVAGSRLVHVLALLASGAVAFSIMVAFGSYRMDRILSFTSAENDPSGIGFHTLQLLVAFGSGGVGGLGLGVSRQKFFYIPGSHTDGVLAILGEELGFIGVMVVFALFAVVLWRGFRIMRRAADPFGSLLATGVVAWIGLQMLINVGGVTRMLPLTGIPLPFLSYGGASTIAMLAAVGVLLSVSRYADVPVEVEPEETRRRSTSTDRGKAGSGRASDGGSGTAFKRPQRPSTRPAGRPPAGGAR